VDDAVSVKDKAISIVLACATVGFLRPAIAIVPYSTMRMRKYHASYEADRNL